MHPDRRERAAARTRISTLDDTVVEIIPKHRLKAIGEVAYQHSVRNLPFGHPLESGIDGFECHPIGVHMQPAMHATEAQERDFGRGVAIADFGIERSCNPAVFLRRQTFRREREQGWTDMQATLLLFGCEQ